MENTSITNVALTDSKDLLVGTLQIEKLHIQDVIDLIRQTRNNLIKSFLYENNILDNYFRDHYKIDLNPVKRKFIFCELSDLLISPVDLVHYSSLILEIIEKNNPEDVINEHKDLFYKDLEIILNHYKY